MSVTDDILDALHAALAASFTAAGLPAPERDRAVPASLFEVPDGASVFANLVDGDGTVDNVLIGGGATGGNRYELTHRPQVEWVVSDLDAPRRRMTHDRGLVAIDDAVNAFRAAASVPDHPLFAVVTDAAVAEIARSNTVFDGAPQIKVALVTLAVTFASDRPF